MRESRKPVLSTSIILMALSPIFLAAIVLIHFSMLPLSGQFMPAKRWEAIALSSQGWLAIFVIVGATVLIVLATIVGRLNGRSLEDAFTRSARGGLWLFLGPIYLAAIYLTADRYDAAFTFLVATAPLFLSLTLAGWLVALWSAASFDSPGGTGWSFTRCLVAVAIYASCYVAMSYWQYQSLHVPHGDTGMYEEHLWNIAHGKGFRSQLDGGRSFLGERFQFSHILLMPIYLLAPSLITLEVCQTIALSLGSFAVWSIAQRMNLNNRSASTLALAYLLYFPLQYLNLEITWKSFRPNSFGVSLVLFALAALEAGHLWRMAFFLLLSLTAAEDYSFVTGSIGLYLAITARSAVDSKRRFLFGLAIALFSGAYLVGILGFGIPYFRGGEPHFTSYFAWMGTSPKEIVRFIFDHPAAVGRKLLSVENQQFFLMMLVPLGLIALASPVRLLMSVPVFAYLMLADREMMNTPALHFHSPLVPILLWATVGGVRNFSRRISEITLARWIATSALVTGVWLGESPLSWKFHDPFAGVTHRQLGPRQVFEPRGSYWRDRYIPDDRVAAFAEAENFVHLSDRVAATDWILPRFIHCERAYDYPLRSHVMPENVDVLILDKTEGWWGRSQTNPDQAMIALMDDPSFPVGKRFTLTRQRPDSTISTQTFEITHHSLFFLVARKIK